MAKVTIDSELCKGCALCTTACPKKIVEIGTKFNIKGYYTATVTDMEKCIGCALCAKMCPDVAIKVEK